jgi:hypothetical protein
MILVNRKKHSIVISNLVVGACAAEVHSPTFDVTHALDAGKELEYSSDNINWVSQGIPTSNPESITLSNLPCDGLVHTIYIREEGNPSNNDSISYTAPVGAQFVTFREVDTIVGECSAGLYDLTMVFDYTVSSGDLEWSLNGGGYTSFTPGTSPDTEIISGLTCDGSTGNVLTLRSVNTPAVLDTYTFDAPYSACDFIISSLSVGLAVEGVHTLTIETTFTGVNGDLEYSIDSGAFVAYTPGASPDSEIITGLAADGLQHTLDVRDASRPECTANSVYTSPGICSVVIDSIVVQPNLVDLYKITINFTAVNTGDLEWSIDGGAYSSLPNFGLYIIGALVPDGVSHTLTIRSVLTPSCFDSVVYVAPAGCPSAPYRDNNNLNGGAGLTGAGDLGTWLLDGTAFADDILIQKSDSWLADCPSFKANTLSLISIPVAITTPDLDSYYRVKLQIRTNPLVQFENSFLFEVEPNGTNPAGVAEIAVYKEVVSANVSPVATLTYIGDSRSFNGGMIKIASQENAPLPGKIDYVNFHLDNTYDNKDIYLYFRVFGYTASAGEFIVRLSN